MLNTKLLAEICEVAGAPGHEQRVREIVLREVQDMTAINIRSTTKVRKAFLDKFILN